LRNILKIKLIPNIDKFVGNKLFYSLKIFSVIISGLIFFLFLFFNIVLKFKAFNVSDDIFYTLLLPNILIIISSLISIYKELIGAILVILIFCFKIFVDQFKFDYFIDLLLINAVINLILFWSLVRDKN